MNPSSPQSNRAESLLPAPDPAGIARVQAVGEALVARVGEVVIGLDATIGLLFAALLAGGHVLLEEVPGTGKTTLAKALARTLGLSFARLQFTPDLLPSDVTGLYWFNQRVADFQFRPGPIFANILLADEINRATPRTQSALLEAMAEQQVTVEGETHPLPLPFLVVATQNPVELEGTFPLPEAQVDRFLMRLKLGYPDEPAEHAILLQHAARDPMAGLRPLGELRAGSSHENGVQEAAGAPGATGAPGVFDGSAERSREAGMREGLSALQTAVQTVTVTDDVRGYVIGLARATRVHPGVELGVSPRGTLFLYRASQAYAALEGRAYVIPDDVKAVAVPVLAHRLMMDAGLQLRGGSAEAIVEEILERVAVPVEPGA